MVLQSRLWENCVVRGLVQPLPEDECLVEGLWWPLVVETPPLNPAPPEQLWCCLELWL